MRSPVRARRWRSMSFGICRTATPMLRRVRRPRPRRAFASARSTRTSSRIKTTSSARSATRGPRSATVRCSIVSTAFAWRAPSTAAMSLWFADGSNYPARPVCASASAGLPKAGARARALESVAANAHGGQAVRAGVLSHRHRRLGNGAAARARRRAAGKVLVDTGHHYLTQNIEQIVAWLLDEGMLGGFHFNDRTLRR